MSRAFGLSLRGAAMSGMIAAASACTTEETGFIDLGVASVAPPPKAKEPPACNVDADCTDPKHPRCDDTGSCVVCLVDGDCSDPGKPRCFVGVVDASVQPMPAPMMSPPAPPPEHACVECSTDVDCTRDPVRPRCVIARGKCVTCTADSDCAAGERCGSDGVCHRLSPTDASTD